MAINKVGSKGIEDGSVASADFAPNTVTSAKLQDGAVTNAKLTNTSVTLAGSSVSLGGSVSFNNKFVDWQSVITAAGSSNTAVSGQGYFIDTTSDVHTVTLPASANRGDFIAIKDYAGTFNTNNLTIARNGHNIQGVANDSLITTNRASLVLVYVDSTKGWLYWEEHNVADLQAATFITATGGTVTESGDYKIHTFTGDGCFVVSSLGNPIGGPNSVDYLVVAGGGAGATPGGNSGGGGGAGGLRFYASPDITCYPASPRNGPAAISVSTSTYPITVGGGSASKPYPSPNPGSERGSDSVFSTITSTGGGDGGHNNGGGGPGNSGGSGGGGSGGGYSKPGGAGNTPPTSPSQGSAGGDRPGPTPSGDGGGGAGGGFLAAGENAATGSPVRTGGIGGGFPTSFVGTSGQNCGSYYYFSGGGGGGSNFGTAGGGALGGGGDAGDFVPGGTPNPNPGNGLPGTANTGGGGGGPNNSTQGLGGAGGKGIVIIRYKFQ